LFSSAYAVIKAEDFADSADLSSVHPRRSNSFTWKRDSKDSWTAILRWPASGDKPAGERTHNMERWPKQ